jgi:hypothetical protein
LGRLSFTNTATTNTAQRLVIIDGVRGADANSGYLQFYTANSGNPAIRMTITSGGNVGIGTSSPTQKLDVVISSGPYNARFHNSSTSTSDYNVILVSQGASGSATGYFGTGGSAASNTSFANTFVIGTQSNSAFVFNTNDAERMRITSGGNVGIGTTNPTEKLDISGTGDVKAIVQTTSSGSGANTALGVKTAADGNWLIQTGNAISSGLRFYDVTNSAERMRITSSGEILVNTTTDAGAYYLQVNGDVYATAYYESSDRRLKDILLVREGSYGINTVTFKWKDQRDSLTHVGYLAQDVEKVLPDAVKTNPNGYKTVNYDEVQSFKIAALEQEVAELKEIIKKLIK